MVSTSGQDPCLRSGIKIRQSITPIKNCNTKSTKIFADEDLSASPNKKVVIIVTDGYPFDEQAVLNYATNMKKSDIRIVTIGAGSGIGDEFIKNISSPNDAYKIDDMSKLQKTFETALLAILEA